MKPQEQEIIKRRRGEDKGVKKRGRKESETRLK